MLTATLDKTAKTLTVVASVEIDGKGNFKPALSKSEKSLIVASSHGNQATACSVDGKPVIIGLNAYIKK